MTEKEQPYVCHHCGAKQKLRTTLAGFWLCIDGQACVTRGKPKTTTKGKTR